MKRLLQITILLVGYFLSAQTTEQTEQTAESSDCTQRLSGEVRDRVTKEILVGAEIVLTNAKGVIVDSQTVGEQGTFSFTIYCNTEYKLEAKKEDYTTENKHFTTTYHNGRTMRSKIFLDTGDIRFLTDKVESTEAKDAKEAIIDRTLPDTPVIIAPKELVNPIAEVKEEAVAEETQENEEVTAEEVVADAIAEETAKDESKQKEIQTAKELTLEPKSVEEQIAEQKEELPEGLEKKNDKLVVKIDPIYFDFDSSYLNKEAKKELRKVVQVLKKYPEMVIESASHTDSKGENKYNKWMSDRRAKRTADYITKWGIDPNRIRYKGYGESQLLNDCADDKDCDENSHAKNRRTEFVIIKM